MLLGEEEIFHVNYDHFEGNMKIFIFSFVQITGAVSQSVRPLLSKGTQCYLITSRSSF